jgi:hypothetical protein
MGESCGMATYPIIRYANMGSKCLKWQQRVILRPRWSKDQASIVGLLFLHELTLWPFARAVGARCIRPMLKPLQDLLECPEVVSVEIEEIRRRRMKFLQQFLCHWACRPPCGSSGN